MEKRHVKIHLIIIIAFPLSRPFCSPKGTASVARVAPLPLADPPTSNNSTPAVLFIADLNTLQVR